MNTFLVLDIETIVNKLYKIENDHTPLSQLEVVCCSGILYNNSEKSITIFSETVENQTERELISKISTIFGTLPIIVTWNGRCFDQPVLQYRMLKYNIVNKNYWKTDEDRKWNNYHARFLNTHTDLCDILSIFGASPKESLDRVSKLLDYPGKLDCNVEDEFLNKNFSKISDYCLIDVFNTFCIYLRYNYVCGNLPLGEYNWFIRHLKTKLDDSNQVLKDFVSKINYLSHSS